MCIKPKGAGSKGTNRKRSKEHRTLLTEAHICQCGPYHIQKAKYYCKEHLDENGDFHY